VLVVLLTVAAALQPPAAEDVPIASIAARTFARSEDWVTTGLDCTLFAAGDIDGDGFADVVTLNGAGQLCWAACVHGWKASPWEVLREGVAKGAVDLVVADLDPAPGCEVVVRYPERDVLFAVRDPVRFRDERELQGDIALCAPVIEREARAGAIAPEAHYAHLVVHGMLHLQGYDHETARDAERMERREAAILKRLGYPDPYRPAR